MITGTLKLEPIYGANTSAEEVTRALDSAAYVRCMKIMALAEALRFPLGRKRPDGKDYQARCSLDTAIRIIQVAREGPDV
jgi:hypothetical protein